MDNNRQQREQDKFVATGDETAVRVIQTDSSGIDLPSPLPVVTGFDIPLYDDIDITYVAAGNGEGEIETVTFISETVPVGVLTLVYNSDNKLTDVTLT